MRYLVISPLLLTICIAFLVVAPAYSESVESILADSDSAIEYVPPSLVRYYYTDKSEIKSLSDAGACIVTAGAGWVDMIVASIPEANNMPLRSLLSRARKLKVLEKNLDRQVEIYKDKADLGLYHTFEEVEEILRGYESKYSDVAKLYVIGESTEGRNIYALKISDNPLVSEDEPGFLVCGMHHAREWIAVEVPLALADKILTTYKSDPEMKKLVSEREIWIYPVQNPDGYVWSTTNYKMWRKNRRKMSSAYGVDPNRNYAYEWGGAGASTYQGSDTYRGPSAASEPITKVMQNFAKEHTNLVGSISFHSYGELILWPWSYDYEVAADDKALGDMARSMAKLNGYAPKKSSDLYPSSGDFDDYMYGECGIASFTFELATVFIPSESKIKGICDKNVKSLLWFIKNCSDPFPVLRHTQLSATTSEGPYPVEVELNKSALGSTTLRQITLNHKFNNGSVRKIAMKSAGSNKYEASIPASGMGKISYYFEVKTSDGKVKRLPANKDYSFDVVSSIYLLVDDDKGRKFEDYYVEALKKGGYPVAVHNRSSGPVTLNQLHSASAVIWYVGSDSSETLVKEDQKVLTEYLKNGGKLLVMGQDLGYELKKTDFYQDVMKAKFVEDTSKIKDIEGNTGTFLDGFEFSVKGNSSEGQKYPEIVSARDGGFVLASYTNGKGAAIGVDSDKCRIAYFGLGLEGIDGASKRAEFIDKVMNWLEGSLSLSAREGLVINTSVNNSVSTDADRALVLSGSALTDKMISNVITAADEGNFEYIRGFIGNDTLNSDEFKSVLRQLFRKLAMDERPEAVRLTEDVKTILSR